jgi:Ser/Thr protein kinase RdoA (MazF antagonist)
MSMSAYSMTYRHTTDFDLRVARMVGWIFDAAQALRTWWNEPLQREPRTAEEVLAWADRYESSQPAYAAELRAIAQKHLG